MALKRKSVNASEPMQTRVMNPAHTRMEMRAQLRRRMTPTPTKIPNRQIAMVSSIKTADMARTAGGTGAVWCPLWTAGRNSFLRSISITLIFPTGARSCLLFPDISVPEVSRFRRKGNAKAICRLTFAFFSPKVAVENSNSRRRAMALTKRQKEVLDYLVSFDNKHGYAPSFEEIGKGLKLTSLATVHKHITTLEKKGFIRRGYNQSRSIEILQLPKPVKDQISDRRIQELPLVGRIAAGRPLEAVEERETLSLGDFARGGNSFVLQVKGSSMIEDHIMDGDYVVCEQTQVANAGDIVVALIGGEEATLKRFYREGTGKIRLQPANSEMAPIMVAANDVKIQGRVIGVLRKY